MPLISVVSEMTSNCYVIVDSLLGLLNKVAIASHESIVDVL